LVDGRKNVGKSQYCDYSLWKQEGFGYRKRSNFFGSISICPRKWFVFQIADVYEKLKTLKTALFSKTCAGGKSF